MMLQNFRRGLQQGDPSPYWNPESARLNSMEALQRANANALEANNFTPQVLPKFDYAARANQLGAQTSTLNMNSALNQAQNNLNNILAQQQQPPVAGGNPRLRAILRALGQQESGNNYGAINQDSGALGRWQVMPFNIEGSGGWDQEALGRNISTEQFLRNKKLQNQIVRYKFGNLLDDYGLKGALSAWYSGDPNKWNNQDSQGNYPSIHQYVMDVLGLLGK